MLTCDTAVAGSRLTEAVMQRYTSPGPGPGPDPDPDPGPGPDANESTKLCSISIQDFPLTVLMLGDRFPLKVPDAAAATGRSTSH